MYNTPEQELSILNQEGINLKGVKDWVVARLAQQRLQTSPQNILANAIADDYKAGGERTSLEEGLSGEFLMQEGVANLWAIIPNIPGTRLLLISSDPDPNSTYDGPSMWKFFIEPSK